MVFLAEFTTTTLVAWVLVGLVVGGVLGWLLRPWLVADRLEVEYETQLTGEREARLSAEGEVAALSSQLTAATDERSAARAETVRLGTELASTSSRLEETEASLATVTLEKDAEIERLGAEAAKIDGLETVIEEQAGRIADLEVSGGSAEATGDDGRILELEHQIAHCAEQLAERDAVIASLEHAAAAAAAAPAMAPDRDVAVQRVAEIAVRTRGDAARVDDDLKRIHGIGPRIEQMLKEMDITSYRQVAKFEPDDIAYVAAALESLPDRIERDDWMSSAATFHEETYGERP